jgi:hypothetical protein
MDAEQEDGDFVAWRCWEFFSLLAAQWPTTDSFDGRLTFYF